MKRPPREVPDAASRPGKADQMKTTIDRFQPGKAPSAKSLRASDPELAERWARYIEENREALIREITGALEGGAA